MISIRRMLACSLSATTLATLGSTVVVAQPVSQKCFSIVLSATTAKDVLPLQLAINAFANAGCDTGLNTILAGLTSSSSPTVEGAVALAYRQSQKRLDALRAAGGSAQSIPVIQSPSASGGVAAAMKLPFTLKTWDGKILKAEAPTDAFSKELLEQLAKPPTTAKQ